MPKQACGSGGVPSSHTGTHFAGKIVSPLSSRSHSSMDHSDTSGSIKAQQQQHATGSVEKLFELDQIRYKTVETFLDVIG